MNFIPSVVFLFLTLETSCFIFLEIERVKILYNIGGINMGNHWGNLNLRWFYRFVIYFIIFFPQGSLKKQQQKINYNLVNKRNISLLKVLLAAEEWEGRLQGDYYYFQGLHLWQCEPWLCQSFLGPYNKSVCRFSSIINMP